MNTLLLFEKLDPILDQENIRSAYRLEIDLLPMVLEMRRRGIRIDQDAAEQARDFLLGKRDAALAKISEQHGAPVGMDEINGRKWKEQDLRAIRHPLSAHGEGQSESFSAGKSGWMATHPHWLPQRNRDREQIRSRRHQVSRRTYSQTHRWWTDSRRDPPVSRRRGRHAFVAFSYSDPPLQQMPFRDEELGPLIRNVFLPEEGEIWCKPDHSQQEFRWLAGCAATLRPTRADEAVRHYRNNPDADFHAMVAE